MLNTVPASFYLASFALAVVSPFLPLGLLWRSLIGSVLALTAGRLIAGGTHWSDENAGHAIGLAMVFMFVVGLSVVLVARLFIFEGIGRQGKNIAVTNNQDTKSYKFVDLSLFSFAGGMAGLVSVIGLATVLGGLPGGRFLDVGIAVIATGAAVLAATQIRRIFGPPLLAFSAVVATVSFLTVNQSRNIISSAEALAHGQPWCLVLPTEETEVATLSNLGFYSLPKGGVRSHLVLVVQNPQLAPVPIAHWSIRRQRFIEGVSDFSLPHCKPQSAYVDGIANEASHETGQ